MSDSQIRSRTLGVVALAACGLLAVSACSSSGSGGKTSSSSGIASSTATSSSSTPSASRSVLGSTSSSGSASASASASPTKSTVHTDPVGACLTANRENNAASSQWNSAVNSQSAGKLDAAAKNFRATADGLRKLPAKSGDKGFSGRIKVVAGDLDAVAKARLDGKTVDTTTYNKDSEKLRSYCQTLITKG